MLLLSVLNVSRADLSLEEMAALSQSTALVVAAISSLLVATLGLPVAGVPGARVLHHPRDSPHPSLLTGRGQQLTAIQNIVHQRLQDRGVLRPGLPVDSSVNLERASCRPGVTWAGYSPVPVAGYGLGQVRDVNTSKPQLFNVAQVSVQYLHTCLAYHEEGSEDRQSMASSALPLFLILRYPYVRHLPLLLSGLLTSCNTNREENLAAAGLDTHSCVHFLTDLFSGWLTQHQDTPLIVLTSAVRAMVMISDIFTQASQFQWMLATLSDLYKVHPAEDELLAGLLLLGICKAAAVVETVSRPSHGEMELVKKGLETCLRSAHLPARAAAVHGLLYLLQRPDQNGGTDWAWLPGMVADHLRANLLGRAVTHPLTDQYALVLWSLAFYTLEIGGEGEMDIELREGVVSAALSLAGQPALPRPLYTALLTGLERLVVSGLVRGRLLDNTVKLATELMTDWPPATVLPATQLFLAAMYTGHSSSAPALTLARPSPITDPETLMQMMEQMSILFDCVRRSGPPQAELLAEILPQVLMDFFPASDVVNRVILEFISPGQPHPALLAGVLKQMFRSIAVGGAVQPDQQAMLTEWVLVSLPNFTRRAPLSHSIWCLSCFFLAASPNPWLQAMFPHLQHRLVTESEISTQHEDRRLFSLAAADFYAGLTDPGQQEKFIQTFEEAATGPGSPYSELLATIEHRSQQ